VKKERKPKKDVEDLPPSAIGSLFMDSGAHALFNRKVLDRPKQLKKELAEGKVTQEAFAAEMERMRKDTHWFYDLKNPDFIDYLHAYSRFIKQFGWAIDFYVTVDAIFDPEKSWEIQEYMVKELGMKPVPVIHHGAPMKWIDRYLDAGYDYLGIGGLGQGVSKADFFSWGDQLFTRLCPGPKRLPIAKTHGFAMTSWELMVRYPWYSVDSASWVKAAAFGQIYVPHKREGRFRFDEPPYFLHVSAKSPSQKEKGRHLLSLEKAEQRVIQEWLEEIGVPLGKVDDKNELVEWGILSHHKARAQTNLTYFQRLADSLPPYPCPLTINCRKGFF
jgi:hypothetical protein